ncbi:uncharacterized protein G2W53_016190 [Senna tora]|uniref:Uncharacterized protein n=1 Tax=Senna tora TaxID=362788 RepID=A0A834WWW6_9FABA|nr:uncharacterized protein G2W53_016190 [Senna tora]
MAFFFLQVVPSLMSSTNEGISLVEAEAWLRGLSSKKQRKRRRLRGPVVAEPPSPPEVIVGIQLSEQSGEAEADQGGEFGRLRGIRRTLTAKSTETAFPRARLEQIREEGGLMERGRGKGHIGHSLFPAFIHHCSTLECSIPFPTLLCLTNTVFELSLLFSRAFST